MHLLYVHSKFSNIKSMIRNFKKKNGSLYIFYIYLYNLYFKFQKYKLEADLLI